MIARRSVLPVLVLALIFTCFLVSQAAGKVVFYGPSNTKQVALTFDLESIPSHWPVILHVLESEHVKGTAFFMAGRVKGHEAYVKEWADAGMDVGTHSLTHPVFARLNANEQKYQLIKSIEIIKAATGGYFKPYFRPPYGSFNSTTKAVCDELGLTIIHWSVDPRDWASRASGSKVTSSILSHVRNGSIVLMHDRNASVAAIRSVVRGLKAKGYKLVTISELLASRKTAAPKPKPKPTKVVLESNPAGAYVYVRTSPKAPWVLKGKTPSTIQLSSLKGVTSEVEFAFRLKGFERVCTQQLKVGGENKVSLQMGLPGDELVPVVTPPQKLPVFLSWPDWVNQLVNKTSTYSYLTPR